MQDVRQRLTLQRSIPELVPRPGSVLSTASSATSGRCFSPWRTIPIDVSAPGMLRSPRRGDCCRQPWRSSDDRSVSMRRRCNAGPGADPARPAAGDAGGPEDARGAGGRRRYPLRSRRRHDLGGRGHRAAPERPDRAAQQPPSPNRHALLAAACGEDARSVRLRLPAQHQA